MSGTDGFAELTLQARDLRATPDGLDALRRRLVDARTAVRGPEEHPGGDRSIYFEDPDSNVVEAWDFFGRGRSSKELADATGDAP